MQFTFVSNEPGTAQGFGFTFKDYQPSTNITTFAEANIALNTTYATGVHGVGETTGHSVYRSPWYTISPGKVLGDELTYRSDRDYSGLFGANPTQIIWSSFVVLNPTTANVGGTLTVNMALTTRMFSVSSNLL
jgi:hypothetical protein